MQSYRKRIAVQMQPVKHKPIESVMKQSTKQAYINVRSYLVSAIRMHMEVLKEFEPLSDEWVYCQNEIFKFKTDFEQLEKGTYEERKGVIEKYGRGSH